MRKPRAVTRANAKKGKEEDRLTIRSSYGYMDPTPYFALKNIEKTEKKKNSFSIPASIFCCAARRMAATAACLAR